MTILHINNYHNPPIKYVFFRIFIYHLKSLKKYICTYQLLFLPKKSTNIDLCYFCTNLIYIVERQYNFFLNIISSNKYNAKQLV